jgi:urea carboxylase-associated protein 1
MSSDLHLAGLSATILHDEIVPARAPWLHHVAKGQTLRIVDLEGNQAVDFLVYSAEDDAERYSAQDTVAAQGNLFLRAGTTLLSNEGRAMMTITASAVDYHDTIGGACSCRIQHLALWSSHQVATCLRRELPGGQPSGRARQARHRFNINFFMNVPVEADGSLGIVDGISAPGLSLDLRAEMDVVVVVSNCPQINNPCNAFNPTPVRMIVAA